MNLQKLRRFFVAFVVTAGGAGFAPKAPGTAGTVMGVLLVYATQSFALSVRIGLFIFIFALGWWASVEWSKLTQSRDAQTIVIDEVLGYWLTLLLFEECFGKWAQVSFDANNRLFIAFVLFRIFDVLKPPPIKQLDRWGKSFEIGPVQSVMVTVDDLLAGVYAAGAMVLVHWAMARF